MKKLPLSHGNPADEDRFWDREHETEQLIQYLDEGANVYLVAQRRIGKTSLIREVSRQIEDRYICLNIDLQSGQTAEDLIVELSKATYPHASLWQKTREIFSNIVDKTAGSIDTLKIDDLSIKIRDGLLGGNWQEKGDRLIEALADADKPVAVFMDEFTILVNRILKGPEKQMTQDRIAATEIFMSWVRKNSLAYEGKIRFVLAGSIGLEPVLRQANLSATINNFVPFELEPWDKDTAIGCLEALAANYKVTFQEGVTARITECLACCIPHHVQMFFNHIYQVCKKRRDMVCCLEDVDHVYEKHMLSARGHAELAIFEERLKSMVGDDLHPFVIDLLTEAAVAGTLSPKALAIHRKDHALEAPENREKCRITLDILEHDGYLRQESQGYVFISHLLRDWWERRFRFNFIIAEDREG